MSFELGVAPLVVSPNRKFMTLHPGFLRVRIAVSVFFVFALAALYLRALASGFAYGTFHSLAHPWHEVVSDIFMLALSVAAFTCLIPALRCQGFCKSLAFFLLLLPAWVLGHFAVWLFSVYGN